MVKHNKLLISIHQNHFDKNLNDKIKYFKFYNEQIQPFYLNSPDLLASHRSGSDHNERSLLVSSLSYRNTKFYC